MTAVQPAAMSAIEARACVDRIKGHLGEFDRATIRDRASLLRYQGWLSLGYATWRDLCDAEFSGQSIALPPAERREEAVALRKEGMSGRQIGAALGASEATVRRDLATASSDAVEELPTVITGLDGRQRPAHVTSATRTTEAAKVEPDADTVTGEVLTPADRYPELAHFADRPGKAEKLANALDGYDDDERAIRREALAATIAAEQRNGGPLKTATTDPDYQRAVNAALAASTARSQMRLAGPAIERLGTSGVPEFDREQWAAIYSDLAAESLTLANLLAAPPTKLRSVK